MTILSQAIPFEGGGKVEILAVAGLAVSAAAKATHTWDMTNATCDITLEAKTAGSAGNGIGCKFVNNGANKALSVTVQGKLIIVQLATNSSGVITSTGALVKAAINASAAASVLVAAEDEGNGSGTVNAKAFAYLTGGTDLIKAEPGEFVLVDDVWSSDDEAEPSVFTWYCHLRRVNPYTNLVYPVEVVTVALDTLITAVTPPA